jgi:hypothetical protein
MDPRYKKAAFIVGLQIYYLQIKGELIYYSKLVRILDGRLTIKEVSRAIDMLYDLSIIRERNHTYNVWQNHNGKWYKVINLTDVAMKFYKHVNNGIID